MEKKLVQKVSKRDRIRAELEAIRTPEGLMPENIVAWAKRHTRSALYSCFEWDDTAAAQQYRLWQAREIIVDVVVTYPDGVERQVYVSPIQTRGDRGGYQPLTEVLDRKDLRDMFLAQAIEELERVCAKYTDLCELAGVREAVKLVKLKKAA